MKGGYKRRKIHFKPGRVPHNKGILTEKISVDVISPPPTRRLSRDEFNRSTRLSRDGKTIIAPDIHGNPSNLRLLRPAAVPVKEMKDTNVTNDDNIDGNRIVDVHLMVEMFNDAIQKHADQPECATPTFAVNSEKKWGLGWACSLNCTTCDFKSEVFKLYREETKLNQRGRKAGLVNKYLQSALLGYNIGSKGARIILNHLNLPAGCKSSMQRQANSVSKAVTALNKADMTRKAEQVIGDNRAKGIENPEVIGISMDGRYNSTTFGSTKKPGQNASQGLSLGIETCTTHKYIISRVLKNKLCYTGAWLSGKGYDVTCPGGHPDCTANMDRHTPMSEYDMGRDIGNQLALQGILVKYATTDGDSASAKGIEDAIKHLHPLWQVERLADPRHLAVSQFRQCNKATFSETMFPGRSRLCKKAQQKTLSQDVKARCSLVIRELMKKHNGDVKQMSQDLPPVLRATISCYGGDCSKCRQHSLVCHGGESNNWWFRSAFLGTSNIYSLQMTETDRRILLEILKLRLSTEAITSIRLGTSTQKNEGCHRAINVPLPKFQNYSRNAEGRLDNIILNINNTAGQATQQKVTYLGGKLSPTVKRSLDQITSEEMYQRQYSNQPQVKRRRLKLYGARLQEHADRCRSSTAPRSDYSKDRYNPRVGTSHQCKGDNLPADHCGY